MVFPPYDPIIEPTGPSPGMNDPATPPSKPNPELSIPELPPPPDPPLKLCNSCSCWSLFSFACKAPALAIIAASVTAPPVAYSPVIPV